MTSPTDLIKGVRDGTHLAVGQMIEVPGNMSQVRLIVLERSRMADLDFYAKVPMLASTRVYILILQRKISGREAEGGQGFSVQSLGPDTDPGFSPTELLSHLERSFGVLQDMWPQEARYVKGVLKGDEDAILALYPVHVPGSFSSSPDLFPSTIKGHVSRSPSPVSRWTRTISQNAFMEEGLHLPWVGESAVISGPNFAPPPFCE